MQNQRLTSLDVFRGMTIALMIIVNNPGSWSHIYAPLRHASWHGWTPTDMVFPFFLFIVGVAISLSFSKYLAKGATAPDLMRKIIRRTLIIFGIGLFLNGWPFGIPMSAKQFAEFEWSNIPARFESIRILGVLQRIALAYFVAATISVYLPKLKQRWIAVGVIAVIYELLMRLPLVSGWGAGSFALEDNFARWIDLAIFGEAHLYHGTGIAFDPEGLLSTLPAIITVMAGVFTGDLLRNSGEHSYKVVKMAGYGLAALVTGMLLDFVEPINKQLWTVSYTVLMAGWAMLVLAFSSWLIDIRNWKMMLKPFIVLGSNAIVAFAGSSFMAKSMYLIRFGQPDGSELTVKTLIYEGFCKPVAGDLNGSLLHAVLYLALWVAITWYMDLKKIYVKI
jgi:predicted acyltransferase